jgi:hypothetical protein
MIRLAELFTPAQEPPPDTTATAAMRSPRAGSSRAPKLPVRLHVDVDATIPDTFVDVSHLVDPGLDRRVGYHRDARYVGLFYEPRGDEVIWNDGASYGFALGGWRFFADDVARLTQQYPCDLGVGATPATHMLVIDRQRHTAYVTSRASAERFLSSLS